MSTAEQAARTWDTSKLDELLTEIHSSVVRGVEDARLIADDEGEEAPTYQVVGYWMYRLLECQDGPLPEAARSINGPLFADGGRS
jgi:hypothetical protein